MSTLVLKVHLLNTYLLYYFINKLTNGIMVTNKNFIYFMEKGI